MGRISMRRVLLGGLLAGIILNAGERSHPLPKRFAGLDLRIEPLPPDSASAPVRCVHPTLRWNKNGLCRSMQPIA